MSNFAKRFVYLKNVKKPFEKPSKIFKKNVARVKFTRVV